MPSRGHEEDSCPDRGQAVQIEDMKRTAVLTEDRRRRAAQIEERIPAAQIEDRSRTAALTEEGGGQLLRQTTAEVHISR